MQYFHKWLDEPNFTDAQAKSSDAWANTWVCPGVATPLAGW